MKLKLDYNSGRNKSLAKKTLLSMQKDNIAKRICAKDPTVWKDGEEFARLIGNRLGWLDLPESMRKNCGTINAFAEDVKSAGYKSAVVLGMGGSSMCPEVCAETFGSRKGYPKLYVLDSTDPASVRRIEKIADRGKTLFIVSSKSGGTIEVDSFFRYFFEKAEKAGGERSGEDFVAVTDPGTQLEKLAVEKKFRKIFLNPPDIGGRYSALSYFGLVPAAISGIDIEKLLDSAADAMQKCALEDAEKNPGIRLGSFAGAMSAKGADKLTFVIGREINSFGYWVEQLIAESTGKEGAGVLPVEGEDPGKMSAYGSDRVFVLMYLGREKKRMKKFAQRLSSKKIACIEIEIEDLYEIGGQFYLWEYATAVMGNVIGINPFDEPNVSESKENTSKVLEYYSHNNRLPDSTADAEAEGIKLKSGSSNFTSGKKSGSRKQFSEMLKKFFGNVRKGDYAAIMSYTDRNKENDALLKKIRLLLRNKLRIATTTGYGPRFLHSTGQLHKGGANNGVFLQIVGADKKDLKIPGRPYTFGILKNAQAEGDFQSLLRHKRRVIRISTGNNVKNGLSEFYELLKKSL